jgi:hypothetical protein
VATYTLGGGAAPLATPGGVAVVMIPAPPPLLPPLPPPPLLAPPLAPPGLPPGGMRPLPEEVPLIPETESLWLFLAGIAVAAGNAFLRRR